MACMAISWQKQFSTPGWFICGPMSDESLFDNSENIKTPAPRNIWFLFWNVHHFSRATLEVLYMSSSACHCYLRFEWIVFIITTFLPEANFFFFKYNTGHGFIQFWSMLIVGSYIYYNNWKENTMKIKVFRK